MTILWLFYVLLLVVIIAIVVLFVTKQFTPYSPPAPALTTFLQEYTIPSPWSTAEAVSGTAGQCGIYTFTGIGNLPPNINLANIDAHLTAGTASGPNLTATCTDSDQIFIQRVTHTCQAPIISSLPQGIQAGGCIKQDGTSATKGQTETYWQICNASASVCPGSIAGVGFGYTGVAPPSVPFCLVAPPTTTSGPNKGSTVATGFTEAPCDLGGHDSFGFPTQLFRVVRAFYTQGQFQQGNGGPFMKIIHRPSGLCAAPDVGAQVNMSKPTTGHLQLVPCNSATPGNSQGYWWMMVPALTPALSAQLQITSSNGNWLAAPESFPQIVYVSDPALISQSLSDTSLFTLLTNTTPGQQYYSICLDSGTNPTLIRSQLYSYYDADATQSLPGYVCTPNTAGCSNFGIGTAYNNQYVTGGLTQVQPKDAAQGCAFQYFDYSIYNLIVNEPTQFAITRSG